MDMDLEKLNRTQIILLTLLVSFITSIATGIVTVSLLEQAPPGVTQTINRVVERTVERVVPSTGNEQIITKETTVVVKEEDLITKSIEGYKGSIVPIYQKNTLEDGKTVNVFVGWGSVASQSGILVTDSGVITDGKIYSIVAPDGKTLEAKIVSQDEDVGVAILQAVLPDPKYVLDAVTFGDADTLKLGQSVIAFGGKEKQAVSLGIISALTQTDVKEGTGTSTKKVIGFIESNATPFGGSKGGPLINIFGEVIGMSIGSDGTKFVSENLIASILSALPKEEVKKTQ